MFYDAERDPLCYPGSSVLRNKADLRDQPDLDDFEFAMFVSRSLEALPDGQGDYSHYRAIHRHLFQDVYDWAGQQRTIRIGKGGNWFCFPENLDRHMSTAFDWLRDHHQLAGVDRASFAGLAAYFLAELNAGHPFREGNGRTQLTLLKVLVTRVGLPFNDDALDPDRTLHAMITSFSGDLGPLTSLVADIVA